MIDPPAAKLQKGSFRNGLEKEIFVARTWNTVWKTGLIIRTKNAYKLH